jgi:hypothetical protein
LKSLHFLEWIRAIAKLAYRDGEDGQYPIVELSITGAPDLLFLLMTPEPDSLRNPRDNYKLPFFEVLNGGRIGSDMFYATVGSNIVYRRVPSLCVFRTEKGYLGFGDEAVAAGDTIAILYGLGSPAILRREAAAWQFLGPCFGVGIMLREGMSHNLEVEDFRIE